MKKILILLSLVFLIPFISADVYQQNQDVDIKVSCLNIDCATSVEITVVYPNTTIAVQNTTMDIHESFANYTFNKTSSLGKYDYYAVSVGGNPEFYENSFKVTSTGKSFSTGDLIGSLGVLFGALFVSSLFMWLGFKMGEQDRTMPFAFLLVSLSIILMLYSLFLGYTFSNNMIEFEAMSSLASVIFTTILWITVGMFVLFIAMMLIAFIRELGNINKTKRFGKDFDPTSNTYQ